MIGPIIPGTSREEKQNKYGKAMTIAKQLYCLLKTHYSDNKLQINHDHISRIGKCRGKYSDVLKNMKWAKNQR